MKLLAGQFIEIDLLKMMWDIVKIILLPVGAGLLVRFSHRLRGWGCAFSKGLAWRNGLVFLRSRHLTKRAADAIEPRR
jgi:hypothetical protein